MQVFLQVWRTSSSCAGEKFPAVDYKSHMPCCLSCVPHCSCGEFMHTEIFDSPSTFMATLKLCQSHPWQQEGYQEEHLVWPGAKCAMKTEWMNTITVTFPVADSFSFYCPSGSMKTPSCTSLRILSSSSCPALLLIWSIHVKPVQKCCFCFLFLCLICICSSCEMTAGEDKKRALGCSKFALNWL